MIGTLHNVTTQVQKNWTHNLACKSSIRIWKEKERCINLSMWNRMKNYAFSDTFVRIVWVEPDTITRCIHTHYFFLELQEKHWVKAEKSLVCFYIIFTLYLFIRFVTWRWKCMYSKTIETFDNIIYTFYSKRRK